MSLNEFRHCPQQRKKIVQFSEQKNEQIFLPIIYFSLKKKAAKIKIKL